MYGQIHMCVRSLVIKKFGQEAWDKIVEKSGVDEVDHFMTFHHYGDEMTLELVGTAAEVLGVPVTTVLEVFGEYFLIYCMESGYEKMLRTLGDNIFTFIQNLDSLHSLLAMSYKNIDAPSFRCEMESEEVMILHYYSTRAGLYPIVTGTLKAVGTELFNINIKCEVLEVSKETMLDGKVQDHATFRINIINDKSDGKVSEKTGALVKVKEVTHFIPDDTVISAKLFCQLFPFHIVFDDQLVIKQCGLNVQKMCVVDVTSNGTKLTDMCTMSHPKMPFTFDYILKFINANFILELKDKAIDSTRVALHGKLAMKGQIIYLAEQRQMIFIGSPRLSSLNELEEKNMHLSDIPLYDVTRELVLLNQQRIAEIEISKKLDETTAELKKTSNALAKEKRKTDMLLYQMLPRKVADSLREGISVDAEKFKQVTILFSDIVTFTNIAAAVQPIDIVNMLNNLYMRFDHLTNICGVYKVETIGDAYMVVGGVPEISETHAQKVSQFSMGMIEKANEVCSPATGKPLQIRVGMHTGPVVAGVVGKKMPRYCLFGDTVNTASRMESHGVPGRIHCSPTTYEVMKHFPEYQYEERGEIEVKGKGLMVTHFLLSGPMVEDSGVYEDEAGLIDDLQVEDLTINPDKGQGDAVEEPKKGDVAPATEQGHAPENEDPGITTQINKKEQSALCIVL